MQPSTPDWTFLQKFAFRFSILFVLLFIGSFSFPHEFLPDVGYYPSQFFEKTAAWTGRHIFHFHSPKIYELLSDSAGFYIHTLLLTIFSLIVAIAWSFLDKRRKNYAVAAYWFFVIVRYYLALQLFTYGFNKVFKWQFYTPEPNTLYTTVGDMHRDFLYWTSMGTSRTYSVFSGMIEVIAGLLLLFRRTKLFGALMALGIMINVLMINLGFDISVKLYSAFLILLCLILLAPDAKHLWDFFFTEKTASKNEWTPAFNSTKQKRSLYTSVKALAVLLLLADPLWLYVRTGNYNDDKAERPPLHGAYEVTLFVKNSDTLPPLLTNTERWKRVFVHRRGYLITQFMNDSMQDYPMVVDTLRKEIVLHNLILRYSEKAGMIDVRGVLNKDTLQVRLKKLDWKNLPTMRDEFSWTME